VKRATLHATPFLLLLTLSTIGQFLSVTYRIVLDVLNLIVIGLALEELVGRWGVARWFNILVMSWVAAIPQTVIAAYYSLNGLYLAAHLDSIMSTVIDMFLISALIGRSLSRSPALFYTVGAIVVAGLLFMYSPAIAAASPTLVKLIALGLFLAGGVFIPLMLVGGDFGLGNINKREIPLFLSQILVIGATAYDIGKALLELKHVLPETAMGVLGAVIGTMPDFAIAIILLLVGRPGEEAVDTMVAAAIHDQVSDPALVVMLASDPASAAVAYPQLVSATVGLMIVAAYYVWDRPIGKALLVLASLVMIGLLLNPSLVM